MYPAIEVIPLGRNNDLFQICDGVHFGLLEFEETGPTNRALRLRHPHVLAFLARWLDEHGVLTGSQQPPRLEWIRVEMAVVAARAVAEHAARAPRRRPVRPAVR
jgi:hypothetical protein